MSDTRTYSDPSFGSKKFAKTAYEGHAINGTNATAVVLGRPIANATTRMTITGLCAANTVIGTQLIANKLIVSTHSAGTGAGVAIGTLSLGTAGAVLAAGKTFVGDVTPTTIEPGDAVSVSLAAGTETAANPRIIAEVEYVESFLVSDK